MVTVSSRQQEPRNKKNRKPRSNRAFVLRIGRSIAVPIPAFFASGDIAIIASVIGVALLFPYLPAIQTLTLPKEGEVSKETIIAPFTFDIRKSKEELDAERLFAMDNVLYVLNHHTDVQGAVRGKFAALKADILKSARRKSSANDSDLSVINSSLSREFSENAIATMINRPYIINIAASLADNILDRGMISVLIAESPEKITEFNARYNIRFEKTLVYPRLFVALMRDSTETEVRHNSFFVKPMAIEQAVGDLKNKRQLDNSALETIYEVLDAYLVPNIVPNEVEYNRRQQQASENVMPTKGKVIGDSEILRKHQVITAEIIQKIYSLHLEQEKLNQSGATRKILVGNAGRLCFAVLPLLFFAAYVRRFHVRILSSLRHVWALASLFIAQIVLIRLALLFVPRFFEPGSDTYILVNILVPTALAPMLAAILFGLEMSIAVSIITALYFGTVLGFDLQISLIALMSGIVSGYATHDIRYRWDFFKAIPPIVGMYWVMILILQTISFHIEPIAIVQDFGLAVINVIVAVFLVMMLTPMFESIFDITTDMTLIELSDMNHPIFKRLSIEASGTYNHSILVGNLAESAAEKIGANALLARVASYYHDIGKIDKSEYFIENHTTDRDRHDKLSPNMSALIISSHVKEGAEMARTYKLPRVIRDAILQHHGTTTVSFFFEKARDLDPHKQVQERDYRYPGPVPQTRENAIIMLADAVEAASRSMKTTSPRLQRELVKKIIREKFMSSQLDQSDLTLRDLDEIVEGFMPILQGIFHTRIEYPQAANLEKESIDDEPKRV